MKFLELKIPPGALVVLATSLMWLVAWFCPTLAFKFPVRLAVALVFACAGLAIAGLGAAQFRRARTTVNPMTPESASALVTSGIYRFTRNPMYLGFLFVLLGWAVWLSNGLSFLFLPAFIFYMNRFQIEPEERALLAKFGQQFVTYTANVRRWL